MTLGASWSEGRAGGKETHQTDTVVFKKLSKSKESVYDQKEFVKEARMLFNIQHDNVISLHTTVAGAGVR